PGEGGRRVAVDYAVAIPPAPVNRALALASRAEHAAGRFVPWPWGGSLLAGGRGGGRWWGRRSGGRGARGGTRTRSAAPVGTPAPRAAGEGRRRPALSVVVPLYDEEPLVPVLVTRLTRVLDGLAALGDAEVILVDDGSRDATFAEVARAHAADPRFRGVAL